MSNPINSVYNNVPFSHKPAAIFLPSSAIELESGFSSLELHMDSFFKKAPFTDVSSYRPPSDFLTRPRRTSGDLPSTTYPQKLTKWFYPPASGHPFVYEEARDLYFSISIPYSVLGMAFEGSQAVPAASRKTYLLNFVSKFDRHLVRFLFVFLFSLF